jgi:hypothetical protein
MILYSPQTGNVLEEAIKLNPRSCFVITQLGGKVSPQIRSIRKVLDKELSLRKIRLIDASSLVTGKDFMDKIWKQILSVPIGIAILCNDMNKTTIGNIFYELGLFDSLGKETLVIKTQDFNIPSDFIRTEYISYGRGWASKLNQFLNNVFEREGFYYLMSDLTKNDPVLSFDYIRRAYLISGEKKYKDLAEILFNQNKSLFTRNFEFHIRDFIKT